MADRDQLRELYEALRAQYLVRHFGLGKYFRRDHASTFHALGDFSKNVMAGAAGTDLSCADVAEGAVVATAATPLDIDAFIASTDPLAPYTIGLRSNENPLIDTGLTLVFLAVETSLGNRASLPILGRVLATVGALFKFPSDSIFAGYPLRYTEVHSDHWSTGADGRPQVCCEFLTAQDGSYRYCTPANDDRLRGADGSIPRRLCRRWEPSFDEICGLVAGYSLAHQLVDDGQTKQTIEMQADALGRYLAACNYILVRPEGGFATRGASGLGTALGFGLDRALSRITGTSYAPTGDFSDAMRLAGVWDRVKTGYYAGGAVGAVAGVVVGGALGVIGGLTTGIGLTAGALAGGLGGYAVGAALGLRAQADAFEVANPEFDIASLVLHVPGFRFRFQVLMTVWGNLPADPKIDHLILATALAAIGDPDDTVGAAFIDFASPIATDSSANSFAGNGGTLPRTRARPLANAIMAHHFDAYRDTLSPVDRTITSPADAALERSVQDMWGAFQTPPAGRAPDQAGNGPRWSQKLPVNTLPACLGEDPALALEYLATVALGWLAAKKRADAGSVQTVVLAALDTPPDFSTRPLWAPKVPAAVLAAAPGTVPIAASSLPPAPGELPPAGGVDAFVNAPTPPAAGPTPTPALQTTQVVVTIAADSSLFGSHETTTVFLAPPAGMPAGMVAHAEAVVDGAHTNYRHSGASSRLLTQPETAGGATGRIGDVRIDAWADALSGYRTSAKYSATWTCWWVRAPG